MKMTKLTQDEIKKGLAQLDGWEIVDSRLFRARFVPHSIFFTSLQKNFVYP